MTDTNEPEEPPWEWARQEALRYEEARKWLEERRRQLDDDKDPTPKRKLRKPPVGATKKEIKLHDLRIRRKNLLGIRDDLEEDLHRSLVIKYEPSFTMPNKAKRMTERVHKTELEIRDVENNIDEVGERIEKLKESLEEGP